jgi:hypothetical protein
LQLGDGVVFPTLAWAELQPQYCARSLYWGTFVPNRTIMGGHGNPCEASVPRNTVGSRVL